MNKNQKKICLFAVLIMLIAGLNTACAQKAIKPSAASTVNEIMFAGGQWKDVAAEAKKTGRYIFVDAYTSWCGPCRLLRSTTFRNKEAAAYYNAHFINYTVDMEKGEGVSLAEKWDVTAYPALLFFTPEGKVVMKAIGYVDGKHFIDLGKQALARK